MSNLSILIVEDEAIVAEDLASKVRQLGYDVVGTTSTGEEAVELTRQHQPVLVLMDIHLAGAMDGIEAARLIHRELNLPVLFLTAHSDRATVKRAQQAGTLGYILKPFDDRDLHVQIEMALYKHAMEQQLRMSKDELQVHQIELKMQNEELLRVQAELAAEKKRYFNLYDLAPDGYFTVSEQGVILSVNLTAASILGMTRESLVTHRIYQFIHKEDQDIYYLNRKQLDVTGEPQTCELRLVRKGGDVFWTRLNVSIVSDINGRPVYGVMLSDINDRKRAEEALQELKNELEYKVEERTRELQESQKQYMHAEKLSAIGQLSASIAHEFNNPLQGILSILKGLKKRAILEEDDKELLDAAISEGNRIKDLIRNLQDFNRPSSGKKAVMDVQNALESILILQKSDLTGRRISVVRNFTQDLPQILAVSDQIKQVFLNLLTNAADACNHHGGSITVSTWQEDHNVFVSIQDTGIGIKPEEMEHIFRPFFTTKAAVKGTGLGLSVSYGIVQKHQGEIRVESQLGEGATFTVLLPIKCDEETASATDK